MRLMVGKVTDHERKKLAVRFAKNAKKIKVENFL